MSFSTEPPHILSADEIWAADDIHEDTVDVPEWGGSVRVRALELEQIAKVANVSMRRNAKTGQDEPDRETLMLATLIEGIIEPKLTLADAARLRKKSANAITRIVQAINALGATEANIAEAAKSDAPERDGAFSVFTGARIEDDSGRAL